MTPALVSYDKFYLQAEAGMISLQEDSNKDNQLWIVGMEKFSNEDAFLDNGYQVFSIGSIQEAVNRLIASCNNAGEALQVPVAVFCDSKLGEARIAHLAALFSQRNELKDIPFILLAAEEKTNRKNQLSIPGVDDVVFAGAPVRDMLDKVTILGKYKRLRSKLPYRGEPAKKPLVNINYLLKRTIDILFASFCLILLSPVFLVIGLLIKLQSKGPVLYSSPRAGKGYRIFKFYKFRTMVVDADKKMEEIKHLNQYDVAQNQGPVFIKINNDPRVTRFGKFLRNSSLDELPQLFNVLKGDMSLVGNRPLPLYEASSLTIDQAAQRFLAPAGITGLWQIKKRGQPNMSVQERINLDIDYANSHSFLYDLRILWNTPKVLIQKADV